jgi:hypothetical protein
MRTHNVLNKEVAEYILVAGEDGYSTEEKMDSLFVKTSHVSSVLVYLMKHFQLYWL